MNKEKSIEAENLMQDIKEAIEKCVECGLCKGLCPVFKIMKNEAVSPRGKIMVLKEEIYNEVLYKCSLCMACEIKCPLKIKLGETFRKSRAVLVEEKKETHENKEMIKNIREFGNPFGKEIKKGGKLYCC